MATKALRKPVLLIALGGNALIRKGQTGTTEEQFANLSLPLGQVARLTDGHRVLVTHGNGPQVGHLMLQQESCREVPRLPLEILVAQTQGQLGYMIESTRTWPAPGWPRRSAWTASSSPPTCPARWPTSTRPGHGASIA